MLKIQSQASALRSHTGDGPTWAALDLSHASFERLSQDGTQRDDGTDGHLESCVSSSLFAKERAGAEGPH